MKAFLNVWWRNCRVGKFFTALLVAIKNYKLLFSLSRYWDALSKLDWWLLWSDEALAMPERVDAEFEKYWSLYEISEISSKHAEILNAFLSHCMLGHSRPERPRSSWAT